MIDLERDLRQGESFVVELLNPWSMTLPGGEGSAGGRRFRTDPKAGQWHSPRYAMHTPKVIGFIWMPVNPAACIASAIASRDGRASGTASNKSAVNSVHTHLAS